MNDPYRTECRAVRELLVALLTGELIAERAALVQNHLAACAACQAELTALRQTQEQAAPLHLESPALDRYPEFLRRLAADDTVRTQQALVGLQLHRVLKPKSPYPRPPVWLPSCRCLAGVCWCATALARGSSFQW
jgi:anti-sigma factor RsiW